MNAKERVRYDGSNACWPSNNAFVVAHRSRWDRVRFSLFTIFAISTLFNSPLTAAPAPAQTNTSPADVTNIVAIPAPEIAAQSEAALSSLRAIETASASDSAMEQIERQLTPLSQEIATRSEEDARIMGHSTSLELFSKLNAAWRDINEELSEWKRSLMRRARQLQANSSQLDQMEATWNTTRESADASRIPSDLLRRVNSVLSEITKARAQVQEQLARTLTLQNRLTDEDAHVRESLTAIDQARQQGVRNLFVRDCPALWSREIRDTAAQDISIQSQNSLARQWRELRAFCVRKSERFGIQALIFIVLAGLIWRGRNQLETLCSAVEGAASVPVVLRAPVASALLIALLGSPWIYSQAPRLLWSLLGTVALVPATIVLRKILARELFPVLNALLAFYLTDQLRTVVASLPLLWRLLFLAEMAAGLVFCALMLRSVAGRGKKDPARSVGKLLPFGLRCSVAVFGAALAANLLGYTRLSGLAGSVLLSAAYLGLILYAVAQVGYTLIDIALKVSPLSRLNIVKRHSGLLEHGVRRVLKWMALLAWIFYVLQRIALSHSLLSAITTAANTRISFGSLNFTLGNVALFCLALWAASMVSRVVRFVLEAEVYPHVRLAAGLHYSISKTVHYAILLIGFLIGLALLGFNLTKLTVLAGAFGVGLGFGMQNIVNNFVSGIILLFERLVKVGDVIQLEDTEGVVRRIGIRASVIRTSSGSEIIVPNAKLISDPVTNWTFSQRRRLITLPIAVSSEAEPKRVIDVLTKVAKAHPLVSKETPVQAILTNLNNGTANFELGVWIEQPEDWQMVRSDLFMAIKSSLAREHIPMK
jgi:small-conductance mechanosensitive channel